MMTVRERTALLLSNWRGIPTEECRLLTVLHMPSMFQHDDAFYGQLQAQWDYKMIADRLGEVLADEPKCSGAREAY